MLKINDTVYNLMVLRRSVRERIPGRNYAAIGSIEIIGDTIFAKRLPVDIMRYSQGAKPYYCVTLDDLEHIAIANYFALTPAEYRRSAMKVSEMKMQPIFYKSNDKFRNMYEEWRCATQKLRAS